MTEMPRRTEVAEYRAAVRRHLADLPAATREDLLADLEAHLAEIAAELEPGASLVDRLGVPEAYAAELREAAEIPPAPAEQKTLTGLADRFTRSAGVGEFGPFWKTLQPGWWVLRGLVAAGLAYVAAYWLAIRLNLPAPQGFSEFWLFTVLGYTVLSLVCVWLSLRLGARSREWPSARRRLVAVTATAAIVLGLLIVGLGVADTAGVYYPDGSYEEGWVEEEPYGETLSESDQWAETSAPEETSGPGEFTRTEEPTALETSDF